MMFLSFINKKCSISELERIHLNQENVYISSNRCIGVD